MISKPVSVAQRLGDETFALSARRAAGPSLRGIHGELPQPGCAASAGVFPNVNVTRCGDRGSKFIHPGAQREQRPTRVGLFALGWKRRISRSAGYPVTGRLCSPGGGFALPFVPVHGHRDVDCDELHARHFVDQKPCLNATRGPEHAVAFATGVLVDHPARDPGHEQE